MVDRLALARRVDQELSVIRDPSLRTLIRGLLVEPYAVERDWDYGVSDRGLECWTVLEHRASSTGIAYCEEGFGPSYPWGLVFLDGPHMGMGMDSAWFASLEDAVRASPAWDGENPAGYEIS